ncbi:prepilin-type N-terminal cleavage/methylation domain-containing protein, partial [Salmonella enterica]|nr:prepilin-type N-terminal cleavage/methylation domain-containing protein [Salmonella enterica]
MGEIIMIRKKGFTLLEVII